MARQEAELPLSEVTIPEMLDRSSSNWSSAALGKWHLATVDSKSGARHPLLQGFDLFAGSLNNISGHSTLPEPGRRSYVSWERVGFDGNIGIEHRFSTTAIVDDAIEAVGRLQEPWFLYVAFHAAHRPLMVPPDGLAHTLSVDETDENSLYKANVEAADHEIGRLLEALGPAVGRTLVFVLGDNGTPGYAKDESGMEGDKGTFLEGGVNVPFLVAGPGVRKGAHTAALAHVVDVFPTLMDVAGVERAGAELDGVSLTPVLRDPEATVRTLQYTEVRHPPQGPPWTRVERAVSNGRLKLVDLGTEEYFYRLEGTTEIEITDRQLTPAERAALPELRAELEKYPAPDSPVRPSRRRRHGE
jgi:arylsulfatase A-like enzyme